jgi:protease PrsW
MTCTNCGASIPSGGFFCGQCGTRVATPPPPAPVIATVAAPAATSTFGAVMIGAAAGDRRLRYGLIGGVGCLAVFLVIVTLAILILSAPSLAALIVSTIAAVLPVPIYAFLILWLDRYEKEPSWLLFGAFFWGALVATLISFVINSLVSFLFAAALGPQWAMMLTPPLVAPPVEEAAKGLAVMLIFLFMRHQLNDVTDGIVYGALVGLGFAMTENIMYFGRAFGSGGLVGVSVSFLMRAIFSGFAHALWTASTGAGLALSRESKNPLVKVGAPIAGFMLAMLLHFLWNGTSVLTGLTLNVSPVVYVFLIVPFTSALYLIPGILTVLVLVYFAWKKERRAIREQLESEVPSGVVTPEELGLLTGPHWKRTQRYWQVLLSHGPAAWLALRHFHEAVVELAFRKSQAERGEQLPSYAPNTDSPERCRERVVTLRQRLQTLGVPTV